MSIDTEFRDNIKTACLDYLKEAGVSIDDAVALLEYAATKLRTEKVADAVKGAIKEASAFGEAKDVAKSVPDLVTRPLVFTPHLLSSGVQVGDFLRSIRNGTLPSASEIEEYDLAREYEREAELIRRRLAYSKQKKKQVSQASSRRLF
jgi:hypothetical protein